ncbi:MAG: response regulator [Bacilli bacterium]|nr:response regulator [Bacilli bacterium]
MGIIWLQITSLVYMSVLLIIYFSSKRINSIETEIFKKIMIANWFGLIIELSCFYTVHNIDVIPIINYVVTHLLLIYYIIYILLFTYYLFIFSNSEKADETYRKKIRIFCYIYFIINSLAIVLLPLHYNLEPGKMYSYGPSVNFMFISYTVLTLIWIICLIKNFRNLKLKKMLPIIILIILGAIVGMVQRIYPELLLMTGADTIVTFIMYFTIENPDMKMIQQLEVAREQADKANRAKTDFLSSMSHEIRTPLNAIVGFSDCIADAKNLGEAQENAKDIVNASQTLLEIVNGILDISKIEAGKIEIINTKYNAPETFEDLAKLITPRMNEKGLDFSYSIAPDLPMTLFGDHANIKKIVTNLLSNACKYTDKGFVHYEVNCINTKNVSKLIISVEDSGRGIKKDSIDKMFTKFQRLDEDRNTTIEGTGLGLAITKQLIELMGGRIIVHTVYGEGSKFTVVLNQKITTADEVSNKKVKSTLDLNGVRILMVDDTPLNIKVGCKLLEKYGANNIITCDSGFECIDRINRGEVYDVILLDDMMPKMSGVETLKKLKENPNFKIPTVALTANAISGMREKYLADGFDDYLAKPIEQTQLIQVMNQVLGRSATEDINTVEIKKAEENIRSEEIPNVEDQEKAEEERKNNSEETPNPDIIPVEDNIEDILGDELDMNYKEKTMTGMQPIVVEKDDEIEMLDDPTITEVKKVETIPVVDIGPIPEVSNVPNLYDREYLEDNGVDVDHALELLGDMDMYNMTISDFVNDVENKWNKIVEYKNSGNMPEYAIEVHSLKSDCKYLGFMKLADIAYQHELKSKENDSNFVNSNFEELETEYKKVLEIAKEYATHNVVEG